MKNWIHFDREQADLWIAYSVLYSVKKQKHIQKKWKYWKKHGFPKKSKDLSTDLIRSLHNGKMPELTKEQWERHKTEEDLKKKGFVDASFYYLSFYFGDSGIKNTCRALLTNNVFEEICVEKYKADGPIDRDLVYTKCFLSDAIDPFAGSIIPPLEITEAEESETEIYWEYKIRAKEEKIEEYVRKYMQMWREERWKSTQNVLTVKNQVERVVLSLYELLEKFPKEGLKIPLGTSQIMDPFAVVLFLESIGCLKLNGNTPYSANEEVIILSITVLPKFYTDFKLTEDDGIEFDMNNLITKEEQEQRIIFEKPKTLRYKNKEYMLRENTFPYIFMNSLERGKNTSFETLLDAFACIGMRKNRESLKKDIKNLRTTLRKRFGFEIEETFFEIHREEIIIKKDLFSF